MINTISEAFTTLDRESPIPLYYQIARVLQQEVAAGKYAPGSFIPTEYELQKRFDVSRATIRQAISDLVAGGILERKRTRGTIVSDTRMEARLSALASFTNEIVSSGLTLRTKILSFKHVPVPTSACEPLGLAPGEMVAAMDRVRYVDDKPVAFEHWYAPDKFFPGLERKFFGETGLEQSTYTVLMKHYGTQIIRAIDTISPQALDETTARILQADRYQPALQRTRVSFNANQQPVTYGNGVYLIRLKFIQDSNRAGINNYLGR